LKLPVDRPALMGILNVTPDSFSDGGLHFDETSAIDAALKMIDDGADLVDVGGESTRPGAAPVSAEEEALRVIPVIRELVRRGIKVSVDTMKASVAKLALQEGARVVNDVSAMGDPDMLHACAEHHATICLMHMQGSPQTMQQDPHYFDVVAEVRDFLLHRCEEAKHEGIEYGEIWIDPGIGFGKTVEHNLSLIRNLQAFVQTGYPVMLGVSRKGFIGSILSRSDEPLPVDQRLEGTLAIHTAAQIAGVSILRAHDVQSARRSIDMTAAIKSGLEPSP